MTELATEVRAIVDLTRYAAEGTSHLDAVDAVTRRLDEPLRVAIAGRVKAGKSTLLNALVWNGWRLPMPASAPGS